MSIDAILLPLGWYVVFLFSTVCHEASHAWAANRLGDSTASRGGQVSLSPWPHVRREPFGTVVVPLVSLLSGGFMVGWASTPFDPAWAEAHPKRAALMALAGPAANLALVGVCALVLRAGVSLGVFGIPLFRVRADTLAVAPDGLLTACATLVSIGFSLNLMLALLNLLPVPPLDGAAAVPLVMSDAAGRGYLRFMRSRPSVAFVGLVLAWRIIGEVQAMAFAYAVRLLW